jgi:hypothetical protein
MRYNGLLMTQILYVQCTHIDLKKQRGIYLIFSDNPSTKKIFIPFLRLMQNLGTFENFYKNYAFMFKTASLVRQSLFNRTDGTKRTNINGHQY